MRTGSLVNLRVLRDAMQERGWAVTCFPFPYARHDYFVFVHRYIPQSSAPQYALVELCFADRHDLARCWTAPANSGGLMIDIADLTEFRRFFGIAYVPNLGDLREQFATALGRHVPDRLPKSLAPEERRALVHRLDVTDGEDPSKVFCTHMRRNPPLGDGSPGRRSSFNSQKTELLRPALFELLRDEHNLSFCYSSDAHKERTDQEILARLSENQGIR
ncbi:DUF6037 family protein [Luteococcus sp. Sow4_B9]|uniref:DUF6037 family protein n=1 Tax=Luteococcus sp. Sow4_B9 TaxID=3438792 RepID=UPI003F9AB1FC